MTSDRPGTTESGKSVPIGSTVTYRGHLPGGNVAVLFEGAVEVMHPHCFFEFRPAEDRLVHRRLDGHPLAVCGVRIAVAATTQRDEMPRSTVIDARVTCPACEVLP